MISLSEKLHAGSPAFSVWIAIGNTYSAEMLATAGYDCVLLDTQHGAVTWDILGNLIQVLDSNRVPSLVRVGWTDQMQIMRALDLGAAGVVVPMVSNVADATAAAQAMHYPPKGVRSFGKVRNYYGGEVSANKPLCFVMIETAEGMANLDDIAAVDGVDGLFVGPVDLALSLGLGPILTMDQQVLGAIEKIAGVCQKFNKICASASFSAEYSSALLERGVQLVVQGSDLGFIRKGMHADVKQFHEMLNARSAGQ